MYSTDGKHVYLERRFLTALLCASILIDIVLSFYLSAFVPTSQTYAVAHMTHLPWLVSAVFFGAGVSILPVIFSAIYALPNRAPARWACFGLCAASFDWMGLAYVSRHLDLPWIAFYFTQNGLLALVFAAAFAALLNNAMKTLSGIGHLA